MLCLHKGNSLLRLFEYTQSFGDFSMNKREIARLTIMPDQLSGNVMYTALRLAIDDEYIACVVCSNDRAVNCKEQWLVTMKKSDFLEHSQAPDEEVNADNDDHCWSSIGMRDALLEYMRERDNFSHIIWQVDRYIAAGGNQDQIGVCMPCALCSCGNGLFAVFLCFNVSDDCSFTNLDLYVLGTVLAIFSAKTNSVVYVGRCDPVLTNSFEEMKHLQLKAKIVGETTVLAAHNIQIAAIMVAQFNSSTFQRGDDIDVRCIYPEPRNNLLRSANADRIMILDNLILSVDGRRAFREIDDANGNDNRGGWNLLTCYDRSSLEAIASFRLHTSSEHSGVHLMLALGKNHIGIFCLSSTNIYFEGNPSECYKVAHSIELVVIQADTGLDISRYKLGECAGRAIGHHPFIYNDDETICVTLQNGMSALSNTEMRG
jgi:hypothetical protein